MCRTNTNEDYADVVITTYEETITTTDSTDECDPCIGCKANGSYCKTCPYN